MMKEAQELAKVIAERQIARHTMRSSIKRALGDKELTEALRAKAWLEADSGQVSIWNDGRIEMPEGWPVGCGSHESEIKARLQRYLYPDDSARESNAWMFEEDD